MTLRFRPLRGRLRKATGGGADPRLALQAATANERRVAQTIRAALRDIVEGIDLDALAGAIRSAEPGRVISSIPWGEVSQRLSTTQAALLSQVGAAGRAEMTGLQAVIGASRFDVTDPRAVAWSATQSGRLVVGISEDVRTSIRGIVTDAFTQQYDYRQTADMISRQVGLPPRWADAVENQHQRNVARFVTNGSSQEDAEKRAGRISSAYRDRLVKARSENIARTEISKASNQGRLLSWEQASERGLVDLNTSAKQWLAEPDACEVCSPLNGETVPANGTFANGEEMPPAHPNCRCAAVLLPDTDLSDKTVTDTGEADPVFRSDDPDEIVTHWQDQIRDIDKLNTSPLAGRGLGDEQLGAIAEAQGFTGLPRVVSGEEFDKLGDTHDTVWRGVRGSESGVRVDATAEELAERFQSGPYWPGFGTDGSGTYVAADYKYSAGQYSAMRADPDGLKAVGLMRIGLPRDGRYIDDDAVYALRYELLRRADQIDDVAVSQAMYRVASDPGRVAALAGYDGILVTNLDGTLRQAVVVNRTILTVDVKTTWGLDDFL